MEKRNSYFFRTTQKVFQLNLFLTSRNDEEEEEKKNKKNS